MRRNWGRVYPAPEFFGGRTRHVAGVIISGFVAVPVLNLRTSLFAATFMTRVVKRLT
jgi:hypothetical protein